VPEPGERLELEELLQQQAAPKRLRATIERLSDDDSRVKVTPYIVGAGCLCASSLEIPKDAIESVTATSDSHYCCGHTLLVVEVTFSNETYSDVFSQLMRSVEERTLHGSDESMSPGGGWQPSSLVPPRSRRAAPYWMPPYSIGRYRSQPITGPRMWPYPGPYSRQSAGAWNLEGEPGCESYCRAQFDSAMSWCFFGSSSPGWCLCVAENDLRDCIAGCTGRRPPPHQYCGPPEF
jgi:hypothetical protein